MNARLIKTICIAGLSALTIAAVAMAQNPYFNQGRETVAYYLDLINSGNFESAAGLWRPASLEQATRLGIEYDGIKFKPDCLSPAVYNVEAYSAGVPSGIDSQAEINDTTLRFRFILDMPNTGRASYHYIVLRTGGYFWLAYYHDVLTADWPVKTTRYFIFHISPNRLADYNDIAAAAMDDMVEKMASGLNLDSKRLAFLAEKKIHFYLCRTVGDIVKFADVQSDGAYRADADVVFSTYLTNAAPVADLLINYKMQKLPRRSDNFMRSGLRAALAGGWQRSADVLLDFGEYILKYNLIEIDTLLKETFGEDNNMTDIAVPAQACFAEYLVQRFGLDKYLNCFARLSAVNLPDDSLRYPVIKDAVAGAFGTDWTSIASGLTQYIAKRNRHGGPMYPGQVKVDKVLLEKDGLKISSSKKWVQVAFSGGENKLFDVGIVFGKDPALAGITSDLMKVQYQNYALYDGFRYGLRLDKNEIGLYDYAVNRLVAKYVTGFDPDPAYYDTTANAMTAYFDIGLLGANSPDMSDAVIIR